jgi:hypothetical protein
MTKGDGEGSKFPVLNVNNSPFVFLRGALPSLMKIKNGTAEPVWGGKFSLTWSPPLVHGGNLYGFNSGVWGVPDNRSAMWCVDLKTGKKLWNHRRVSAAHIIGVDGCLLIFTFEGDLWLVKPSAKGFKKITEWKGAIKPVPWWTGKAGKSPSPCWTMPTIARGKIYLRCSDRMVAYDLLK